MSEVLSPDEQEKQLTEASELIWQNAREKGLDPFPTHFHLVPAQIMYEFGAYGLPGRFSHWTHGQAYRNMKTMYDFGLGKIYELVINNDPAHGFLLENNKLVANKLVIAHVLAHVDFFKNNIMFADTNRQMLETVNLNADRIRSYSFVEGVLEVEQFLDLVLSIQQNVDPLPGGNKLEDLRTREVEDESQKIKVTPYDDLLHAGERKIHLPVQKKLLTPPDKTQNLLGIIALYSPILKDWQRDIILIVMEEMNYFLPQMHTKIMNEGWAAYWHLRLVRDLGKQLMSDTESLEFASMHAAVISPSSRSVNPYRIGLKIFEDLEQKYSGEYSPDPKKKQQYNWWGEEVNYKDYIGRQDYNPFWVRENIPNDQAFLRNYLTPQLVEELDLYTYKKEGDEWVIVEKDPEMVIKQLVSSLTNFGHPVIEIPANGVDYNHNHELQLVHAWEGHDLDLDYMQKTLKVIYKLWGRPVHLQTKILNEGDRIFSCTDGKMVESKAALS